MKKSEIVAALSAIITIVVINSVGVGKISPKVKIFTLVLAPIFVLWIILKYKKPKKTTKIYYYNIYYIYYYILYWSVSLDYGYVLSSIL